MSARRWPPIFRTAAPAASVTSSSPPRRLTGRSPRPLTSGGYSARLLRERGLKPPRGEVRTPSAAPLARRWNAGQGRLAGRGRRCPAPPKAHHDHDLCPLRHRGSAPARTAHGRYGERSDDIVRGPSRPVSRRAPSLRAARSDVQRLILRPFITFADAEGDEWITTDLFLRWKDRFGTAGTHTWAIRLSVVRGFAAWLQGIDPRTEVPPRGLIPNRQRRQRPYIYTDDEIARIVTEAARAAVTPRIAGRDLCDPVRAAGGHRVADRRSRRAR